jgi:hypothetical protein
MSTRSDSPTKTSGGRTFKARGGNVPATTTTVLAENPDARVTAAPADSGSASTQVPIPSPRSASQDARARAAAPAARSASKEAVARAPGLELKRGDETLLSELLEIVVKMNMKQVTSKGNLKKDAKKAIPMGQAVEIIRTWSSKNGGTNEHATDILLNIAKTVVNGRSVKTDDYAHNGAKFFSAAESQEALQRTMSEVEKMIRANARLGNFLPHADGINANDELAITAKSKGKKPLLEFVTMVSAGPVFQKAQRRNFTVLSGKFALLEKALTASSTQQERPRLAAQARFLLAVLGDGTGVQWSEALAAIVLQCGLNRYVRKGAVGDKDLDSAMIYHIPKELFTGLQNYEYKKKKDDAATVKFVLRDDHFLIPILDARYLRAFFFAKSSEAEKDLPYNNAYWIAIPIVAAIPMDAEKND